jgi:hypothetical protein
MTQAKSFGQVAYEATHDPGDSDYDELFPEDKQTLETQAQAVIAEYERRVGASAPELMSLKEIEEFNQAWQPIPGGRLASLVETAREAHTLRKKFYSVESALCNRDFIASMEQIISTTPEKALEEEPVAWLIKHPISSKYDAVVFADPGLVSWRVIPLYAKEQ